jgi:hypothetical protein
MNVSQQVYDLCTSAGEHTSEEKSEELTALLQEHPEVDLELFRSPDGSTVLHASALQGHKKCAQVLIEHKADLEARNMHGHSPIMLASGKGHLECMKVLIEARADVGVVGNYGGQATHLASSDGHLQCLQLLISEGADVNAQTKIGSPPVMFACDQDRLACVQLLLDAKADIHFLTNTGVNALYYMIRMLPNTTAHRVPGMPFAVLSCNTNTTDTMIDEQVTQIMIDAHIAEYKAVHAFIDEHHNVLKHVLSRDVQVDWRVGLGENGIYQEPLERVLEYMGLSIGIDQVVNESIDGHSKRRALLPGNVLEANHWHEEYTKAEIARARQARRAQGGY